MSEAHRLVALGDRARKRGERLCLATVVHVEGSSYRKPGARMLLTSGGEHAGTISGGCLEAEVSRKAWWLTADGARIERYSSFPDEDGGMPYGLGCGGTVTLLLEQGDAVQAVLRVLRQGLGSLEPAVVVTAIHSPGPEFPQGTIAVLSKEINAGAQLEVRYLREGVALPPRLAAVAREVCASGESCFLSGDFTSFLLEQRSKPAELPAFRVEYLAPPPAITIFGAGDDAQPLAHFAQSLGWRVTVADGRAHLARPDRFPGAAEVRVLDYADPRLRAACGILEGSGEAEEASEPWAPAPGTAPALAASVHGLGIAVILTHSYQQDRALLAALLPLQLTYLGVLGPRHRTERLLDEVAPVLGLTTGQAFARLRSPVGLDLGSGDPAAVALSIVAQMQAVLNGRSVEITRGAPGVNGVTGSTRRPWRGGEEDELGPVGELMADVTPETTVDVLG